MRRTFYIFVFILFVFCVNRFYFLGSAPVEYCRESEGNCKSTVAVYFNRLNTEESLIPYDYNYFDFCTGDGKKSAVETLGQVVLGDRIRLSPYSIEFLRNDSCHFVCTKTYYGGYDDTEDKLQRLRKGIALNYKHHWIVDNMPVTWCITLDQSSQYCSIGFPIGCYSGYKRNTCFFNPWYSKPHAYYLFNHVDITVTYHSGESEDWGAFFGPNGGRIISIKVVPRSIKHNKTDPDCSGQSQTPLEIPSLLKQGEKLDIVYSYSVKFVKNNTIKWSSRWDYIFQFIPGRDIQWFSILPSLVLLLVHSGIVSRIMLRILQNDNSYGKQVFPDKHIENESRWKLLHGDVFRSPKNEMLLSVLLGSGAQVLFMALITVAILGIFSPENRGAPMTCSIISFVCLGSIAGYVSARIYKTFGGEKWKANVLLTSLLCPGFVFGLFFLMNIILWSKGSSAAVSFTTLVALLSLWFGVSVPLTFIGAYFGFRKRSIEHPVGVNYIPRQIPSRTIFTHPISGVILGGFMPFVCILIQLHFVLNMLWTNEMHYIFGFLFLDVFILLIMCAESTILLCYYHLLAEDYHWWWRSFLTGGFTAFYFFIYCIHYFVTKLNIADVASTFLYFGSALIMAFLFFLLTGAVGFLACFWFVRKIYSVVKCDWLYQELNVFSVNDI